jgi:AcrR family transcriptional regulator
MDVKEKILKNAEALFMRYGIRSVTMDDIARDLGISKKTLYQYVENKSDLIFQIVEQFTCQEQGMLDVIKGDSQDPIEEMLNLGRHIIRVMRTMGANTLYDLRKYYPQSWEQIESLRKKHVYQAIMDNIERGQAQGLYRADITPDIIAKLYVEKTGILVDEEVFPLAQYNRQTLLREFMVYHIRGIASKLGLQQLDNYLADPENSFQTA